MKNYYAEFLEIKKVNTLYSEVSKVSKGQNITPKAPFDTFDTSLPNAKPKKSFSEDTITNRLKRMVAGGVSFEVGGDDFEAIAATELERTFLLKNKTAILCTFHQWLLMKYLPFDSIACFKDEINERTAILSDGATIEPPFEIVSEVSRRWFIDMLEELLKR